LPSFAENEAEMAKMQTQIETLEQDINELQNFSDRFPLDLAQREESRKMAIFTAKLISLYLQITITKSLFKIARGEDVPKDSLIELHMRVLSLSNKTPIEYVRHALPVISNGVDLLKQEKTELEAILNRKIQ
jgi:hypothetical protein